MPALTGHTPNLVPGAENVGTGRHRLDLYEMNASHKYASMSTILDGKREQPKQNHFILHFDLRGSARLRLPDFAPMNKEHVH